MITVEELKAKFAVRDVAPYGSCIVVPGAEFDPDWEVFLGDQGYKCFFIDLNQKPVTLVKLPKDVGKSAGEKEVYRPRQPKKEKEVIEKADVHEKKELAELSPWQDPSRRWKPEEDELIIALWNQKHNVSEIHVEMRKRFPNRSINTTVTIQLSVNCNDRNAVANLFDIIEKMGLRKKEVSA